MTTANQSLIQDIRNQINDLRCQLKEPTKIYMSLKLAAELEQGLEVMRVYANESESRLFIYGLPIYVHDDYDVPVVR